MSDGFAKLPEWAIAALVANGVKTSCVWLSLIAVARQHHIDPWTVAELDAFVGLSAAAGRKGRANLRDLGLIHESNGAFRLAQQSSASSPPQTERHERSATNVAPRLERSTATNVAHDRHERSASPYIESKERRERSVPRERARVAASVPKEMAKRNRERPEVDVMRVWCEAWKDRTGKAPIQPVVYRTALERVALWIVDEKQPATHDDRDAWVGAAVDVVLSNAWATRENHAPRCVAKLLRDGDVQSALDAMSAPGVRKDTTKSQPNGEKNGQGTETHTGASSVGATIADYSADFGHELDIDYLLSHE